MRYLINLSVCLTLLLSGCGSGYLFEDQVDLKDHKWSVAYVPEFSFNVEDTINPYNIMLNLRYSNLYQYQNIYMTYILEDPEGNRVDSTLTNIQLFEAKTGKPLGDGLGDIFAKEVRVLEEYRFSEKGEYRIRLRQTMRPDTLQEVVSVGINIGSSSQAED